MGIVYPGDFDFFNVPTLPEGTSLSSAGSALRNHTELHDDINKAVMALEANAALKTHDHSGVDGIAHGQKLAWNNTHQSASAPSSLSVAQALADTDDSPLAIHHTLGTGANQAAPGNHTHTVVEVPQHYRICTSSSRPSAYPGLMIFETDTNLVQVWATYDGRTGWHTVFGAPPVVPVINNYYPPTVNPPAPQPALTCRLRQRNPQKLNWQGTIIEWQDELEDPYNCFNPAASLTSIIIRQAGIYQIDCALQWNPQIVPDVAKVVLCKNGQETEIRNQAFMRGNLFTPGFSQTLSVSGKVRFEKDDVLTVKASFEANNNIIDQIFSFVEQVVDAVTGQNTSVLTSRLEIANVGA